MNPSSNVPLVIPEGRHPGVGTGSEPRVVLEGRLLCDLELLVVGGFAPLTGFLRETEYNSVVDTSTTS